MTKLLSFNVLCLIGAGLAVAACSKDDDSPAVTGALSEQGESCERTADCAAGLACFSGTCRPAELQGVTPNDKECAIVQCQAPADCCTTSWTRSYLCASYEEECALDPTLYASACQQAQGPDCVCSDRFFDCTENICQPKECDQPADCCTTDWVASYSCESYASYCATDPVTYAEYCTMAQGPDCVCDPATYACNSGMCVSQATCTTDTDCYAPTSHCSGTVCVECIEDGDCLDTDAKCIGNACVTPECETDLDCPPFYACEASDLGRECVEKGCATDRECIIYENSYLATCNLAATPLPQCEVKCTRDAECALTSNPLRLCSDAGLCVDPGCDTDEECKLRLGSSPGLSGAQAVCRDKVAP